jgi:hypothetical protein
MLHIAVSSFFFILFHLSQLNAKNSLQLHEEQDFVSSFINNYGFTLNSRDTHEYHSFILGHTRESFSDLENHLARERFALQGRMVICGYQEDAIPSYYTSIYRSVIDDEVSIKTKAGWHFASGNLFGYVTGFVLKDVNDLLYGSKAQQVFEHNQPERVGLFDDRAEIFHRHAFGQAYPLLLQTRNQVLKAIAQKKPHSVIALLRELWKYIYARGISDGSKTTLATQDILFSIHYAQYLLQSKLPMLKFFVGPDITYPIEILRCQKEEATRSAQKFVSQFVAQLKPIQDGTTAYVFCSFVDGVGKSTLLGNIRNFARHGNMFDLYERVDNSSSQRATVWQLQDGVVIADLPAQASHFITKPDGFVYVSIDTVKAIGDDERAALISLVKNNGDQFKKEFKLLLNKLDEEHKNKKLLPCGGDESAVAYAKNLLTLGKEVQWIPFEYNSQQYLFNLRNSSEIRILQPLEGVHSYGLKVAEPEQMIFSKGIALPFSKELFLKDLSDQLREYNVKNIVFVDFMSMYPRTSRENIRVNFMIQQLKYIFGDLFDIKKSLYKGFMQPQELYLLLKKYRVDVVRELVQETGLRWALFLLLQRNTLENITHLPAEHLIPLLKAEFEDLYKNNKDHLMAVSKKKIAVEYEELLKAYVFDKEFESVVRFDFESVIHFSSLLRVLCAQEIRDDFLNTLWNGIDEIEAIDKAPSIADESKRKFIFSDGSPVEVLYTFDPECRNKLLLKEFFTILRAHWYPAIANLLKIAASTNDLFAEDEKAYRVPALAVVQDQFGLIRVVRKQLPIILDDQKLKDLKAEHTHFISELMAKKSKLRWGEFFGDRLCLDLKQIDSGAKLFAFGLKESVDKKRNSISFLVDQFNYFNDPHKNNSFFMPTAVLKKSIIDQNYWHPIAQEMSDKGKGIKNFCSHAARKCCRYLATFDMLCKDLDAQIMTRKGNKDDFAASLELFEKITLPFYFDIKFSFKLFDSYESVEPVLAWEVLDN